MLLTLVKHYHPVGELVVFCLQARTATMRTAAAGSSNALVTHCRLHDVTFQNKSDHYIWCHENLKHCIKLLNSTAVTHQKKMT